MNSNFTRRLCSVALLLLGGLSLFAQVSVKGVVKDLQGQPIIGAGVVVEGNAAIGTITDIDGNYSLQIPADAKNLVFSFVGMTSKTEAVAGRSIIDVVLEDDAEVLEGVVVTALGIKRSEKAVTYNVQKLSPDTFVTREANMVNSLAGRLAGVQVNTTAAGVGAETKVVMRGSKSIQNSNNALYVLDGIPLPELSLTKPGDGYDIYKGSGLTGDGISNFNSEDIADMSALVGPSAAALYGYKAANGVLMLTSRTGEKGFSVSYSNNTTFSTPWMLPQFQTTYGAQSGRYASWGEKLTSAPSWNKADFFRTGYNSQHSLSLSVGGENHRTYVSAGLNDSKGIIPNNDYRRYNFTARHSSDHLNNKLHVGLLAMYIKVKEQNMLSGGLYHNPLVPIYLMSPSDNIYDYATYERYDMERNFPVQYWSANELSMQNPFWTVNRNMFTAQKDRFLAGASLTYDITPWLEIQGRARTDMNMSIAEQKHHASSNGLFAGQFGRYYYNDYKTTQTYADVLLNVHKTFGDNLIQLNAVLGASIEDYFFRSAEIGGDLLGVANLFTFTNMETGKAFVKNTYRDQTQSIFATAQLGFRNYLFLDLTGRADWASQLASAKNGIKPIFYPSVGLSAIITDMIQAKSDIIPFAKVRVSYAEVGNPITRFISNPTYAVTGGSPTVNTWQISENFQPERTKSFEAGADVRMFKGSLQLSGTFYKSSTFNQVFTPTISSGSTSSTIYINAGRVDNLGVELSAQYSLDVKDFNWTTNLIWSKNVNKIVTMLDADYKGQHYRSERMNMGGTSGVRIWLEEGRPIGELYVSGLVSKPDGEVFVTPTNMGASISLAPNDGTPDTMWYAGNVNPDWTSSWRNSFSWKGLTLSAMITARVGGVGVSLTEATLDAYGVSKRTADARDAGGVCFAPADLTDPASRSYYTVASDKFYQTISGSDGQNALGAYYTYSMTNVRLAELSLGYDIPVKKFIPFVKGLNVAFVGRNLAMIYCKSPFDPELVSSAGNYGAGIDLFMMPSTRNLGFSVKLTF